MGIPFIDLKAQYKEVESAVKKGIDGVLEHGAYVMGPEIGELESRLSSFSAVRHAVGCASGTDALIMALMAFEVGPGDAIFTTPFTFMATAESIALLGATPVFVDIDPVTFNIDPDDLRRKIGYIKDSRKDLTPKGVIAVDLFGQPADYDAIEPLTHNNGLFLIVDAAQSFGATYKGKPVCSLGDMACTSFFPAKPLGCYGDGGMVFAHNDELHKLLVSIRIHGMGENKYENVRLGINGRLDSMQAAVLLAKFEIFPNEITKRQAAADRYAELLGDVDGLTVPTVAEGCTSVWAQYSLLARDGAHREDIMGTLSGADIPSVIYYPRPLHLQKAFAKLGHKKGDFPVCENIADRIFSLPMHPYLSAEDQETIAGVIKGITGDYRGYKLSVIRILKPVLAGLALAYFATAFVDKPAPVNFQLENPYAAKQAEIVEPEVSIIMEKNIMKLGSPLSVRKEESQEKSETKQEVLSVGDIVVEAIDSANGTAP